EGGILQVLSPRAALHARSWPEMARKKCPSCFHPVGLVIGRLLGQLAGCGAALRLRFNSQILGSCIEGWRMKFAWVNGRTPCPQSYCAQCCTPIGASYLREIATRLSYCNHKCYVDRCKIAI